MPAAPGGLIGRATAKSIRVVRKKSEMSRLNLRRSFSNALAATRAGWRAR